MRAARVKVEAESVLRGASVNFALCSLLPPDAYYCIAMSWHAPWMMVQSFPKVTCGYSAPSPPQTSMCAPEGVARADECCRTHAAHAHRLLGLDHGRDDLGGAGNVLGHVADVQHQGAHVAAPGFLHAGRSGVFDRGLHLLVSYGRHIQETCRHAFGGVRGEGCMP